MQSPVRYVHSLSISLLNCSSMSFLVSFVSLLLSPVVLRTKITPITSVEEVEAQRLAFVDDIVEHVGDIR
jgi:hypothetical protein